MQSKRRRLKYLILHDTKYTFAFGVLLGIGFAGIFHVIQNNPPFLSSIWPAIIQNEDSEQLNYDNAPYNFTYEKWLLRTYSGLSCALDPDVLRYSNGSKFYSTKCGHMLSSGANLSWFKRDIDHADPRSEAYFLSSNVSTKDKSFLNHLRKISNFNKFEIFIDFKFSRKNFKQISGL